MIKTLALLLIISITLSADTRFNIFITSFAKDKESKAKEYQKTLKEYLLLQDIKQNVVLEKSDDAIAIKVVNFFSLEKAKEAHDKLKNDFKNSFIQESSALSLEEIHLKSNLLLMDDKPQEAYELLYQNYKQNNFNNQTLFLLGNSAKQNGDIKNAISFFEELIELDPNAHRIRLDLAALYYDDGQYEKADEQFLIVRSAKIPSQVEANIKNYKLKKQLSNQKNYTLSASLGYLKDSNVNVGPNIDTITMYDIDFTLSNDAKETEDDANTLKADATLYNQFKHFLLKTSLSFNKIDYDEQNDYDSTSYTLSTGPVFFSDDTMYIVPLNYSNIDMGSSDDYYLKYISLNPSFKKRISPTLSYSLKLNIDKKSYKLLPNKDGITYGLTYGAEILNDKTSNINFTTFFNKNESKNDIYSFTSIGAGLSYTDVILKRIFFIGSVNYSTTSYAEAEDAFAIDKEENNLNGSLNFIYDLNLYNSSLMFSYFRQKNSSNIDLYAYKRSQSMISFNIRY